MEEMEFKAKIVDGKPVVEAITERIENEDGSVDIIIHAPALNLINKIGE